MQRQINLYALYVDSLNDTMDPQSHRIQLFTYLQIFG